MIIELLKRFWEFIQSIWHMFIGKENKKHITQNNLWGTLSNPPPASTTQHVPQRNLFETTSFGKPRASTAQDDAQRNLFETTSFGNPTGSIVSYTSPQQKEAEEAKQQRMTRRLDKVIRRLAHRCNDPVRKQSFENFKNKNPGSYYDLIYWAINGFNHQQGSNLFSKPIGNVKSQIAAQFKIASRKRSQKFAAQKQ